MISFWKSHLHVFRQITNAVTCVLYLLSHELLSALNGVDVRKTAIGPFFLILWCTGFILIRHTHPDPACHLFQEEYDWDPSSSLSLNWVPFLLISAEIFICNFIYNGQTSLSGIREAQGDRAGSAKLLLNAVYILTCTMDSFLVKILEAHKPSTAIVISTMMLVTA